jgi:hypothetical protein
MVIKGHRCAAGLCPRVWRWGQAGDLVDARLGRCGYQGKPGFDFGYGARWLCLCAATLLKASSLQTDSPLFGHFGGNHRPVSPGSDDGDATMMFSLLEVSFWSRCLYELERSTVYHIDDGYVSEMDMF